MSQINVNPQEMTVLVNADQSQVIIRGAIPGPAGPPGEGLADPGANGVVVRTALNTTTARTITAGTNVTVSNGSGVSGNPTVNVPDASTTTKGAVELAENGQSASGLAVQANDSRLSDSRTPTAHASTHVTGGSDKIRDATASQDGLMTLAYAGKLDGIEAGADVTDAQNVGSAINGSAAKTTPVDADAVPILDSAASNVLKKLTWANLKATLKTYFDALYPSGSGTSTGTNTGDQNLFGTIAVSGQSNVVADTTADTLTLVAGANVTITTDPSTDSVTIAAAGGGGGIGGSTGATDNRVLRADGGGGATLQNSAVSIADDGKTTILLTSNTDQALTIQGTDRSGSLGTNNYGGGLRSPQMLEVSDGSGVVVTSANATVGHFFLRGDTDAHVAALKDTAAASGFGTNPQTLRIYETNPSSGNYERLTISAAAGTNVIKPEAAGTGTASKVDYHLTATNVRITSGSGSPEGVVSAPVGSEYHRTDGGTGTTLYIKESGSGNTGWVAVAAGGGTGDVDGPVSATDNAIARFDTTSGKLIQNSVVTISDTGDIAGVDSIQFDTAAPATLTTQGQMAWNIDEETLDIQLNSFIMHTGEHLLYHVKNQTLSTIAKGVPVMFDGTDGSSGKLLIKPWNGTGPSTYFMGLTAEQLLNDEEGFVIAFGKLRGIQTNGGNYSQTWTDGEIIYAGTTTGSLTDTAPAAPNPRIQVCAVVNAHASNGTLFIRPTYGSNIKDDEGVTITSLTTGDLLIATSGGATGVFENKAMSGDATLASTGVITIASDAVTNAKLANMAQSTIKGRAAGAGTGDPTDLSSTQATAILDNFVGDSGSGGTKGLVPAPAAGDAAAGKYLDSDGTWSVPSGSGGLTALQDTLGGDFTVTNSNTLADVTGFNVALTANKTYLFFLFGSMQSSGSGNGARLGFTLPSGSTCMVTGFVDAPNSGNGFITASGGYVQQTNIFTAAGQATLQGIVANGANAGNLQIQIACELTTGTATIKTDSRILAIELP